MIFIIAVPNYISYVFVYLVSHTWRGDMTHKSLSLHGFFLHAHATSLHKNIKIEAKENEQILKSRPYREYEMIETKFITICCTTMWMTHSDSPPIIYNLCLLSFLFINMHSAVSINIQFFFRRFVSMFGYRARWNRRRRVDWFIAVVANLFCAAAHLEGKP
jgi:hypothetical protein